MAANALISTMTGVKLHDYGCTFKAYRASWRAACNSTARCIDLSGDRGRAGRANRGSRSRISTRGAGISKYGLGRIVRTFLDLITVKFLSGYSTAPIQVFGLIGIILADSAACGPSS